MTISWPIGIAHKYQHILLYHRDPTEELWLNEALSEFCHVLRLRPRRHSMVVGTVFWERQISGLTNFQRRR